MYNKLTWKCDLTLRINFQRNAKKTILAFFKVLTRIRVCFYRVKNIKLFQNLVFNLIFTNQKWYFCVLNTVFTKKNLFLNKINVVYYQRLTFLFFGVLSAEFTKSGTFCFIKSKLHEKI